MSAERQKQLEVVGDDEERFVPVFQIVESVKKYPLFRPREVDAGLIKREHVSVGSRGRGNGKKLPARQRKIVWMYLRLAIELKQAKRIHSQFPRLLLSKVPWSKFCFPKNSGSEQLMRRILKCDAHIRRKP